MAKKKGRGFAAMNPQQQREIASKGGRAAHQRGTAHEWDSSEAAAAGRKGGRATHHRHGTSDHVSSERSRVFSRDASHSDGPSTQQYAANVDNKTGNPGSNNAREAFAALDSGQQQQSDIMNAGTSLANGLINQEEFSQDGSSDRKGYSSGGVFATEARINVNG